MLADSVNLTKAGGVRAALLLFLMVLCISMFSGALLDLQARWSWYGEEYSHGVLIPIVAAWLLWSRRNVLGASFGPPVWAGPVLILAAMVMCIIGELSAIYILAQLGFIVALLGIVLTIGGYSLFRVTIVPIAFLIFAIPPPNFVVAVLTFKLQILSSELGAWFISLFQIPVFLDGNIIDLGDRQLEVAEACSGLRYLFPLLSLGFLLGYLFRAPLWQRIVVFLSTIPITIAMNSLRIGMVGVTVAYWGPQMADEVLHDFEGWLIFVACFAMLMAEIYLFARLSGKAVGDVFRLPLHLPPASPFPGGGPTPLRLAPVVAALCLLCATGLATHFISGRSEMVPDRLRFATFPAQIGQWQGHASSLDQATERGLNFDDYILSDYVRSDGKGINLYVAYYASQHDVKTIHPPLLCLPGSGWNIASVDKAKYRDAGGDVAINRLVIEQNSTRQVVYYWYVEGGRKIADEYWAKWYLLLDAMIKNRSDGSLVRVTTPILFGETERDAEERLQSFMRDALPSLAQYLPSDASHPVKSVLNSFHDSRS
jgi:exosortase D (VPLPA-CTERM-specific)